MTAGAGRSPGGRGPASVSEPTTKATPPLLGRLLR